MARRRNTQINRRRFLQGGAMAAAATLTSPLAFLRTKTMAQGIQICGTRGHSPYGPLFPVPDAATGLKLLLLPTGFSYSSFSWKGDILSDGNACPSGHDGMAIVAAANPGGQAVGRSQILTLIRNHEVFGVGKPPIAPDYNYD